MTLGLAVLSARESAWCSVKLISTDEPRTTAESARESVTTSGRLCDMTLERAMLQHLFVGESPAKSRVLAAVAPSGGGLLRHHYQWLFGGWRIGEKLGGRRAGARARSLLRTRGAKVMGSETSKPRPVSCIQEKARFCERGRELIGGLYHTLYQRTPPPPPRLASVCTFFDREDRLPRLALKVGTPVL